MHVRIGIRLWIIPLLLQQLFHVRFCSFSFGIDFFKKIRIIFFIISQITSQKAFDIFACSKWRDMQLKMANYPHLEARIRGNPIDGY